MSNFNTVISTQPVDRSWQSTRTSIPILGWGILQILLYVALLDCIDTSLDALTTTFPKAMIVLAGDFNSLDDSMLVSRTTLNSIVTRPTRGVNILD